MKTMTYSKQQLAFIKKVDNAIAQAKDYNYTINDTTSLFQDLVCKKAYAKKCNAWWTQVQRPYLAQSYKRMFKRYGYVDRKLWAKAIYNTLTMCEQYTGDNYSLRYIKREWLALSKVNQILLCYELAKTFRK